MYSVHTNAIDFHIKFQRHFYIEYWHLNKFVQFEHHMIHQVSLYTTQHPNATVSYLLSTV